MKKTIILLSVLVLVLLGVGVSSSLVKATSQINSQITVAAPTGLKPGMEVVASTGQNMNEFLTSFDPISNVPAGVYVAHVQASQSNTIDVQRFIDPATSVACYYSESAGEVISVNCVSVSPNAI